jgi:hypothetical protein
MESSEWILTFYCRPNTVEYACAKGTVYREPALCERDWKRDGIPREMIAESTCIAVLFTDRKRNIWGKKEPYRFLLFRGALRDENGFLEIEASIHNRQMLLLRHRCGSS